MSDDPWSKVSDSGNALFGMFEFGAAIHTSDPDGFEDWHRRSRASMQRDVAKMYQLAREYASPRLQRIAFSMSLWERMIRDVRMPDELVSAALEYNRVLQRVLPNGIGIGR